MVYFIIAILVGVNLAPFATPKLYLWLSQELFGHLSIMIAFAWSFFDKPKDNMVKNLPLTLFFIYLTINVACSNYSTFLLYKYNIVACSRYLNFICILVLYNIIIQYLNRDSIILILKYLKYTLIGTLLMCTLQKVGLSQFFELLYPHLEAHKNNLMVGFIGNPTHLSGFLASCIPLLLWKEKREDWLALILLSIVLCFAGETASDPAVSGPIIAVCLWLYMNKTVTIRMISTIILLPTILYVIFNNLPDNVWSLNGRDTIWRIYWPYFKMRPVIGHGLGSVYVISNLTSMPSTKHLHMEYFHYAIELGIVGVVFIVNIIKDFFDVKARDKEELVLKGLFLGFCLSCCFNYPSHLWLPSLWACFAYASFIKLRSIK